MVCSTKIYDMTIAEQEKYNKAKKKVEELKGFYIHFAVYLVINSAILLIIYLATLKEGSTFWTFGHFSTLIFWGVGLAFHAAFTFSLNPFFGREWEARQIKKYMDKDSEESQKHQ